MQISLVMPTNDLNGDKALTALYLYEQIINDFGLDARYVASVFDALENLGTLKDVKLKLRPKMEGRIPNVVLGIHCVETDPQYLQPKITNTVTHIERRDAVATTYLGELFERLYNSSDNGLVTKLSVAGPHGYVGDKDGSLDRKGGFLVARGNLVLEPPKGYLDLTVSLPFAGSNFTEVQQPTSRRR